MYADPETGLTGTTSACAENTSTCGMTFFPTRNYLRVRGEYLLSETIPTPEQELPPRARRILMHAAIPQPEPGTTSACAENTSTGMNITALEANYLRVRGEYCFLRHSLNSSMELPPRARRIPQRASNCQKLRGTTSACAENTCVR